MNLLPTLFSGYRATFKLNGRMSRQDFWALAPVSLAIGLAILFALPDQLWFQPEVQSIPLAYFLLTAPVWSAGVRRLQDVGIGGGIIKLGAVLLVGGVIFIQLLALCDQFQLCVSSPIGLIGGLLVFLGPAFLGFILAPPILLGLSLLLALNPSDPNTNQYGPNPTEVSQ